MTNSGIFVIRQGEISHKPIEINGFVFRQIVMSLWWPYKSDSVYLCEYIFGYLYLSFPQHLSIWPTTLYALFKWRTTNSWIYNIWNKGLTLFNSRLYSVFCFWNYQFYLLDTYILYIHLDVFPYDSIVINCKSPSFSIQIKFM